MLPAEHRLRRQQDFALAVRRGRRASAGAVVAYLHRPHPDTPGARVGFVVSKSVGAAVVRNQVRRRLRHSLRDRLGQLPAGSLLVVRALPAASIASSGQLSTDVDRVLAQVTR